MGGVPLKRILLLCVSIALLSGCRGEVQTITLLSREEGSGTRSALWDALEAPDETAPSSEITNSTAVVVKTVSYLPGAIGYVPLSALTEAVKPLSIQGVFPTETSLRDGTYPISRTLSLCYRPSELTPLALDFLTYVQSAQAQDRTRSLGYLPAGEAQPETTTQDLGGTLQISGSTSVAPLLEVLAEDYCQQHPQVRIDIQQTGSSAGIIAVTEGTCPLGMTSRALTQTELDQGLVECPLALDGIVVIVHRDSPWEDLSLDQLRDIFSGSITQWDQLAPGKEGPWDDTVKP
jgi:phosphate transport system substrate-binding protein